MVVEYVESRTLVDMNAAPTRRGDCDRGVTALMRVLWEDYRDGRRFAGGRLLGLDGSTKMGCLRPSRQSGSAAEGVSKEGGTRAVSKQK